MERVAEQTNKYTPAGKPPGRKGGNPGPQSLKQPNGSQVKLGDQSCWAMGVCNTNPSYLCNGGPKNKPVSAGTNMCIAWSEVVMSQASDARTAVASFECVAQLS